MRQRIRFSEIESEVPGNKPGIYEIHTDSGIALKVGISCRLKKRLLQHRTSRDSALELTQGGSRENPGDVKSKGSILAKHLYYDASLTTGYDLRTETGRRAFLEEVCYIVFQLTEDTNAAREEERRRERDGAFRYVGRVVKR